MTTPYLLIEDNIAEGIIEVEDVSFKNIKPGGHVRCDLARMKQFRRQLTSPETAPRIFSFYFYWNRAASYNMATYLLE